MTLPWAEFLTVWTILALNIASPGPNVLNTIATAMGSGRAAGMGAALGVGLGIGVWCLGMALGMAAVFVVLPLARGLLTALAIALLLWFAARYLRTAWAGYRRRGAGGLAERQGMGLGAGFRRSLAVNLLNPKALTSWLAIVAIFPLARAKGGDIALLCAGACGLSFSIHTVYALAFSAPPAARFYLRHAWIVSGATGLFFLSFAAALVAEALGQAG